MLHACFYTICLVFRYTSWHFYAFSGTNLLTRCHSVSFLFFAVFVFQKSYTGNILGIGRNKSRTSRNLPKLPENRRGDRKEPGGGLTTWGVAQGLAAPPCGEPHLVHFWRRPFAYKDPPTGKTKTSDHFSRIHRDPPPSSTQDREGPEALLGTLPERGIATGGLLHRHACLRRDEWVVYWYVSNVSIIFDAPCLFLHHLPCVSLHFVAFLCDFRN
jgi:hypothetical protein